MTSSEENNMKYLTPLKKQEHGSLTVEAVLFLIPFMLAFLTLLNIARFVQAEMLIHHSITQTAKQVSTYSYVLTKAQISAEIQKTNQKSAKFETDTTKAVNSVTDLFDAMGSVGSGDPVGEINHVITSAQNAETTLIDYFSNPDALLTGVISLAQSKAEQAVLTGILGGISGANLKTAISKVTDDPNNYLEKIGIVDGIDGLDYSQSKWISNTKGKGNLQVVVTYKMKNLLFPSFDFGEFQFCQCASTLIW